MLGSNIPSCAAAAAASSSDLESILTGTPSVEGESPCAFTASAFTSPSRASSRPRRSSERGWQGTLHLAAQKGHDHIVRVLLEHKTDCNERDSDGLTPLMHATIGGYDEVAVLLLSHGACIGDVDGHGRSALHWAVLHRREGLLRLLLAQSATATVEHGAFVDGYDEMGRTPLHTAVDTGFEAGVHVLLQLGASPHNRARKS